MTQYEERRQQQIDRATAKRAREAQGDWVKHTINLRKKTRLNEIMETCGNKSHFVRNTFERMMEMKNEVNYLKENNQKLRANIMKLQAVITEQGEAAIAAETAAELVAAEEEPRQMSAMEQWAQIQKGIYDVKYSGGEEE